MSVKVKEPSRTINGRGGGGRGVGIVVHPPRGPSLKGGRMACCGNLGYHMYFEANTTTGADVAVVLHSSKRRNVVSSSHHMSHPLHKRSARNDAARC